MNELIGYTIKTHDNAYVGQVKAVERTYVSPVFRKQFGIQANEPYVAYAVEIDESPKGWSTLIARDEMEIHKRYVI
jgi:hypothetical protein